MLTGYVDSADRHQVSGWAADARRPNAAVELVVFVNGTPVARIMADQPRPDLAALGVYGDGRHGFRYRFDMPLSLLRKHEIVVALAASREVLGGGRVSLPKGRIEATDELTPVMISSTGRSGTTLLMRRLANDKTVVIGEQFPFEVKLVTYYAHAFEVLTAPGNREKSVHPDRITADPYHLGSNPYYHQFFEGVFPKGRMLNEFFAGELPPIVGTAFKQIITRFYRRLTVTQPKPEARFFAEKCDVFNTARDFARALYRGTREIVLVRDPRDVFCSQRAFFSAKPAEAFQGLRSVRDRMLEFHQEGAENLIFLKYEDLVGQPNEAMQQVSSLLALDQTIEIDEAREAAQFKTHGTSRDPAASIGRWQQELTAEERARFDSEFGQYLDLFDYERANPVSAVPHDAPREAAGRPADPGEAVPAARPDVATAADNPAVDAAAQEAPAPASTDPA